MKGKKKTRPTVLVPPARIIPPNEVRDPGKLAAIAKSMRTNGWRGRPLLVEDISRPHDPAPTYQAWTGSHRTRAAAETGTEVPCLVITSGALERSGFRRGTRPGNRSYWDGDAGFVDEHERAAGLRRGGDEQAAKLSEAEDAAK